MDVPDHWEGKSILQIDIRKKYGINILGIKRHGELSLTIDPNRVFDSEDSMLVLGTYKDLRKCFHI